MRISLSSAFLILIAIKPFQCFVPADSLPPQLFAVESLGINIHLTFAPPLLSVVSAANEKLYNQTIRFPQPHTPHVTLYLSQFPVSSLPELLAAIAETAKSPAFSNSCSSNVSSATVTGSYMMLSIAVSSCLQRMSDILVAQTHHLALPNQTAPEWIESLPEPQRSVKKSMLHRFGSPNVFSQFEPHITLACSANATELALAARNLDLESLQFNPLKLHVSRSGACGTVRSDETLLSIDLLPFSNSSGNISQNSCAAFKVVSLQTGNSGSCSGGNLHIWPLLPEDHCHGWSAVDNSGVVHKNSANGIRCITGESFSFVQFANSLNCSGTGYTKTFYAGKCIQVKTSMAADFLAAQFCVFYLNAVVVAVSLFIIAHIFVRITAFCRIFLPLYTRHL